MSTGPSLIACRAHLAARHRRIRGIPDRCCVPVRRHVDERLGISPAQGFRPTPEGIHRACGRNRVPHPAPPAPRDHQAGGHQLKTAEEPGDLLAAVVVQLARPRRAGPANDTGSSLRTTLITIRLPGARHAAYPAVRSSACAAVMNFKTSARITAAGRSRRTASR